MKHVYIIDPKPFHGQQWKMDGLVDTIGQYFRTQEEKPNFSTLFSHYPRNAIGLIQKQVAEAEEFETVRVYAIGGDNMLFDCLGGIAGLPNMELAIAPYGATNDFIRIFGEKKVEQFKDIESLSTSGTIPTDIIAVGNNFAINGCCVGIIPAIAMKKSVSSAKFSKGVSRFTLGFWYFLDKMTPFFNKDIIAHQYKLTIDDEDYSGAYSLINIVNSPYFGRKKNPLTGSAPDDGLLDVILFKSAGPFSTSRLFKKYARGKLPSNCIRVQAKKIEIKSDTPIWIQTDSEYLLDTSITFEVMPEAVQVVAVNNLTYQRFLT
jgi:diacylglycerol kinase family enzyme